MKITVVYATLRKTQSTTYQLAQRVIAHLKEDDEVVEFYLPRDMDHFCGGCFQCIEGRREKCAGYKKVEPIKQAMDEAELIIFAVPVYVYHAPGQVKALLDHFAYRWMVHQVDGKMFTKQALIISTAAGAGMKSAIKDVKDSMDFWGIGRVYSFKKALFAANWTELKDKQKEELEEDILKIAEKIKKRVGKVTPRMKVKCMFYGCRLMQKKVGLNAVDVAHWKKEGFLDGVIPWKKN